MPRFRCTLCNRIGDFAGYTDCCSVAYCSVCEQSGHRCEIEERANNVEMIECEFCFAPGEYAGITECCHDVYCRDCEISSDVQVCTCGGTSIGVQYGAGCGLCGRTDESISRHANCCGTPLCVVCVSYHSYWLHKTRKDGSGPACVCKCGVSLSWSIR